MLASDRAQHRADQQHRSRCCSRDLAPWGEAQRFDPEQPWDRRSAEALTCLYESEEGRLSRPAAGGRTPRQSAGAYGESQAAPKSVDRQWMEAHLSRLVERLQEALAQASPEPSLAALNGRLETIEQRFGATLGHVAQRADLDGLRSIEAHVLELAGQLKQTRERVDRIGALDEHLREVARSLDEAGEQRTNGLERLLRDCMAEWREGAQRTAGALQSLEEAVGRLGDAVDAMEAMKPAPELTVPPLTGSQLGCASGVPFYGDGGRSATPQLYHAMLDAADYAPRPSPDGAASAAGPPTSAAPGRLPAPGDGDQGSAGARLTPRLTPGALRIMALRAKLRQGPISAQAAPPQERATAAERLAPAVRRAGLSLLLVAGTAALAGSTYLAYRGLVAVAPASPVTIERSREPAGVQSSAPLGRHFGEAGAG